MEENSRIWSSTVLVILALYGLVYQTIELQPSLGLSFPVSQMVGIVAIIALFVAVVMLMRTLPLVAHFKLMCLLSVIGITLSVFLTYAHFESAGAVCPAVKPGEAVACDIVNQSVWSEIAGIPVATLGGGYYMVFLFFSMSALKQYSRLRGKKITLPLNRQWLLLMAVGGLVFTVWLNYIQIAVLWTLCVLCELSATTIILLLSSSIVALKK